MEGNRQDRARWLRRRRQLTRRYRRSLGIGPERCDLQVEIVREEAGAKYALLDAADRFRWVWYSGGHGANLRDPATLEQIGGWFARHLS